MWYKAVLKKVINQMFRTEHGPYGDTPPMDKKNNQPEANDLPKDTPSIKKCLAERHADQELQRAAERAEQRAITAFLAENPDLAVTEESG